MENKLEQLRKYSVVVADTGDIEAIRSYQPQDATTNPSLLLKAAQQPQYGDLLKQAINWANQHGKGQDCLDLAVQRLMVVFGAEILKIIPGRVSTEVDAHYSFDTQATIEQAQRLIAMYNELGFDNERVLIKVASTWEGLEAAKQLEKQGIHCNLTLLFDLSQAAVAADYGVTLISPFVGRIYDWYKAHDQREFSAQDDPGVQSVRTIFNYYKHFNYPTIIMGASFRHTWQVEALAGCDYLTISPDLLQQLQNDESTLSKQLDQQQANTEYDKPLSFTASGFRSAVNQSPMAEQKLADGIRRFAADWSQLKQILAEQQ